jgi:23S rRNA (uridine2552-2'-O)-methyltransferase
MSSKNKRSASSRRWLDEHENDFYVKLARKEGYRSRAVYKLAEIDEREHLFLPKNKNILRVVDLGAAPGGWSQWIIQQRRLLNQQHQTRIIAVDILPIDPLPDVTVIQGDFQEDAVAAEIYNTTENQMVDLVISDISPNISGMKAVDQPRAMYLAELAADLAFSLLKPQGHFLTKIFQGEGFDAYVKMLRPHFDGIKVRKPKASRPRSREVYLLARSFKSKEGNHSE